MRGVRKRRVIIAGLCLLLVLILSVGLGAAAGAASGPLIPQLEMQLDPSIVQELIDIGAILALGDPVVTDVEPNGGLTSGGGEVLITGTGFNGATEVTFGGTPATSFTVDSDTEITAVVPMHAPGTVQVMVIEGTKESPDTSADDYTYVQAPTTTAPPTTAPPTTAPPTTAAPTETTVQVTTTVAAAETEGDGISGGWIAFIAVIAVVVVGVLGFAAFKLGQKGK